MTDCLKAVDCSAMPVPNPNPTTLSGTVTVHDRAGAVLGTAALNINSWELVIEATLAAGAMALPVGQYRIRTSIGMTCAAEPVIQPKTQHILVSQTLVAPGTILSGVVYNEGHRSIDGHDVIVKAFCSIEQNVGGIWRWFGQGEVTVAVPPQTTSLGSAFVVCAQHQVINSEQAFIMDPSNYAWIFDQYADVGYEWLRFSIPWAYWEEMATSTPYEPWASKLDTIVATAKTRGLKVMVIFGPQPPCWASTDPTKNCTTHEGRMAIPTLLAAPSSWALYEDAVKRFVDRYVPDAIEVGNEPNAAASNKTAATHTADVTHVWNGVKASAHPNVKVIGGILAFSDVTYLQQCYDAGIKAVTDVISVHPYSFPPLTGQAPWVFGQADPRSPRPPTPVEVMNSLVQGLHSIHKVMRANGDGTKPIWISEWGFTSGSSYIRPVDELTKGAFIREGFRLMARLPYVEVAGHYTLADPAGGITTSGGGFGLVALNKTPRPSYPIVKAAITGIKTGVL